MDLKNIFYKIFNIVPREEYQFTLPDNYNYTKISTSEEDKKLSPKKIYQSIDVNLDYIKTRYNTLINNDIVIREFYLTARNKQYKAFLLFIDGMVDSELINSYVLKPLMLRNSANTYELDEDRIISEAKTNNITIRKVKKFDIKDYILEKLIPENNVKAVSSFDEIINDVNSGNCALFIDTIDIVFDIDVKGFEKRVIDTPQTETVIKGPQEGFVENLRTNTSSLRRIINNEGLIIENIEVGNITKTKCAICYMKDIANSDLVAEVKYRINNIKVDSMISSGELEQLISDSNDLASPRVISTERPDTVSRFLLEGRVAVIVNGTPFVIVMPATLVDFLSTPEDINLKPAFSNFLRVIRLLGALIILLVPGIYVAITGFHQEIFPSSLLFSILAARENVPFPVIIEIILMEISFELIREAGLRLPQAMGFTVSIVGALVIGQAAVDANLISPPLVIIVAITAIASSSIPDFAFGFHLRLSRFIFILLGFIAGFLGISLGLFVYVCMFTNLKSFGLSSTVPFAPYVTSQGNKYFLPPIWKREYRPAYLDPKISKDQDEVSMKWRH